MERVVLRHLLDRPHWLIDELRELVSEDCFAEALAVLEDSGLLIREDDVVYATPAALRGDGDFS